MVNTTVIIPCFNEAKRLDLPRFQKYLADADAAHLLFVDDGSRDDTADIVEGLCTSEHGKASLLRLKQNGGKAEAVRAGIMQALDSEKAELVGFWDADLATPLETIGRFVEVLHREPGLEMVFGARVKLLGRNVRRNPRRHYLGRVFATVVSNVLQLPIYDTQCGAKLFRSGAMLRSAFDEPFLSKWVFDVEILARYRRLLGPDPQKLERLIYEYPLESWEDVAGSKIVGSDFLVAFSDVLKIRAKYLRF